MTSSGNDAFTTRNKFDAQNGIDTKAIDNLLEEARRMIVEARKAQSQLTHAASSPPNLLAVELLRRWFDASVKAKDYFWSAEKRWGRLCRRVKGSHVISTGFTTRSMILSAITPTRWADTTYVLDELPAVGVLTVNSSTFML